MRRGIHHPQAFKDHGALVDHHKKTKNEKSKGGIGPKTLARIASTSSPILGQLNVRIS